MHSYKFRDTCTYRNTMKAIKGLHMGTSLVSSVSVLILIVANSLLHCVILQVNYYNLLGLVLILPAHTVVCASINNNRYI